MSLERIYTSFTEFVSNCVNTGISLLKIIFSSRFNIRLPHANANSCVVLGTGPSLSQSLSKHPDFFRKQALVCVNRFCLSKEYTELKPSYYVMLDPGFWLNMEDEGIKKTLNTIIEQTNWELRLLLPQKAKHSAWVKQIEQRNAKIKISYFNYTVFKGFTGIAHRIYAKNLAMPQSQNVLVAAIFLTINLDFKKIYVVGADHNWHENLHINEQNQLCVKDVHFYENESKVSYRLFYKDAEHRKTFTMHEILFTFSKAFYGYQSLKKYADFRQVSVYNASEISFIDAFERVKIEDSTTRFT